MSKVLERTVTKSDVAQSVEFAKDRAKTGNVPGFENTIGDARKYAERLGAALPELGYSDEAVKAIETEALTKGVVTHVEYAKSYAKDGNVNVPGFKNVLGDAEKYAHRLETTVAAVIGPKQTATLQQLAQKLGVNVDVTLGVKAGQKPGAQPSQG